MLTVKRPTTDTAHSESFGADVGVGVVVGMPTRAMSFASVPGGYRVASQGVFSLGHGLKVIGVHATADATEVIQGETLWDRSDEIRIRPTVSINGTPGAIASAPDPEVAIAAVDSGAAPQPAATLGEVSQSDEPLYRRASLQRRNHYTAILSHGCAGKEE